jgi:hypothetical protein
MQTRTRRFGLASVLALGLVTVMAGTALAQAGSPNIGTWKGNVAKSKFAPGTAAASFGLKVEAAGGGTRSTVDSASADGTVRHWVYTTNYDGKESPITGNCQWGDAVTVTRVDANNSRSVYKLKGVVTVTQTSSVSADGKTRTVATKGKNALGQAVDNVNVYDKQ